MPDYHINSDAPTTLIRRPAANSPDARSLLLTALLAALALGYLLGAAHGALLLARADAVADRVAADLSQAEAIRADALALCTPR